LSRQTPGLAARTPFISVLNTAMKVARQTGLAARPVLEKDALLQAARDYTGLEDFGDPWFEQPFEVLLQSLHAEARLNPAGEFAAAKQFVHVLSERLWAQQWFAGHPEILARPMPRPVIILGPMRSGTTRLQRLLACDRRFSHLRSFETVSPVPRPGFVPGGPDQRIKLQQRIMRLARLANPRTLAIHPTGPFEAEEELGLLVNSMWSNKHESQWYVPSYGRWSETQNATPAYQQMVRLLKLVGWSQQASSLRPWILKTPQHMLDLAVLLKLFPDARLIFSHRDPVAVVGSACSLAWNQTIIYSDHADPKRVGHEWLRQTRLQVGRMQAARATVPPERAIDIHFDEMERDWRAGMARIYAFLGLDIEPALAAMEAYDRRAAAIRRRPHRYSLEPFGLSAGQVLEELSDYTRTYITAEPLRARLPEHG
jgi:hypothetical protein